MLTQKEHSMLTHNLHDTNRTQHTYTKPSRHINRRAWPRKIYTTQTGLIKPTQNLYDRQTRNCIPTKRTKWLVKSMEEEKSGDRRESYMSFMVHNVCAFLDDEGRTGVKSLDNEGRWKQLFDTQQAYVREGSEVVVARATASVLGHKTTRKRVFIMGQHSLRELIRMQLNCNNFRKEYINAIYRGILRRIS